MRMRGGKESASTDSTDGKRGIGETKWNRVELTRSCAEVLASHRMRAQASVRNALEREQEVAHSIDSSMRVRASEAIDKCNKS